MNEQSKTGLDAAGRPALWLRALSRLPFGVLYALTGAVIWVLRRGLRFRVAVARDNLRRCFPERTERQIPLVILTPRAAAPS